MYSFWIKCANVNIVVYGNLKVECNLKAIACPQHLYGLHFRRLRVSNSEANIPSWPKIEFVQVFMPVLATFKFHKDPIKNENSIMSTTFFSSAQGHVTPKLIDRCGWNLNSSEILCLFWFLANLIMIQSKVKALLCPQHFPNYNSTGKIYDAQGQVIPQQIVRFGRKSNLSEILYLSLLSASFTKIRSKMKTLSCPQPFVFLRTRAVTPRTIDGCGRNSNSSEILCLSWLPASLMTIQSKHKALLCPHNFLHCKYMAKHFRTQGRVST